MSATLGFALDHQQSKKMVKSIHDKVNMRGFAEAFEAGYWGPFHKRESKSQGTHYRRMFRSSDFNFYGV